MFSHPYAAVRNAQTPSPLPSERSETPTSAAMAPPQGSYPKYPSVYLRRAPELSETLSEVSSEDSYIREPMPNLERLGKSKTRPMPQKPGMKRPGTGESEGGYSVADSMSQSHEDHGRMGGATSLSSSGSRKKKVKFTPSISSSIDGSHEIYGSASSESSHQMHRSRVAISPPTEQSVVDGRETNNSFAQANALRVAIMEQREAFGPPTPVPPTDEQRGPNFSTKVTVNDEDSPPPSPVKPIAFGRKPSTRAQTTTPASIVSAPQTISLLISEIQSASTQPPPVPSIPKKATQDQFSFLNFSPMPSPVTSAPPTHSQNPSVHSVHDVGKLNVPAIRQGVAVVSQAVEPGYAITSDNAEYAPKVAVTSPAPVEQSFLRPGAWPSTTGAPQPRAFNSLRAVEDPKSTASDRSLNDQLKDMIASYNTKVAVEDTARMQAFRSASPLRSQGSGSKSDSEDFKSSKMKIKVDATGGIMSESDGFVSDGEGKAKKKKKRGFFSRKKAESPPPVPVLPPQPLELPNIGLEISQGPRFSVNTLLKGVEVKWNEIEKEEMPKVPSYPQPVFGAGNGPSPAFSRNPSRSRQPSPLPAISENEPSSTRPPPPLTAPPKPPNSNMPPYDPQAFENPREMPIPRPRPTNVVPLPDGTLPTSRTFDPPSRLGSRDGLASRDGIASRDGNGSRAESRPKELSNKGSVGKLRKPKPEKERMKRDREERREERQDLHSRPVTPASALSPEEREMSRVRSRSPMFDSKTKSPERVKTTEKEQNEEQRDAARKIDGEASGPFVGEKALAERAMQAIQKDMFKMDSTDRKLRANRGKKTGSRIARIENWRYAIDDSGPESGPGSDNRHSMDFDLTSSPSSAPTSPPTTIASPQIRQMPSVQESLNGVPASTSRKRSQEPILASSFPSPPSNLPSTEQRYRTRPEQGDFDRSRAPVQPAASSSRQSGEHSNRISSDSRKSQEKEMGSRNLSRSVSVDSVLDPMLESAVPLKYGKNRKAKRPVAASPVPPVPVPPESIVFAGEPDRVNSWQDNNGAISSQRQSDEFDRDANPFYLADTSDTEEPRFRFLKSKGSEAQDRTVSVAASSFYDDDRSQRVLSFASYYGGKYERDDEQSDVPDVPPVPPVLKTSTSNQPIPSQSTGSRPKLKPGEASRLKARLRDPAGN
ncbi:hypothetical protein BT69DRAFT_1286637 [Atractiella rhizophila]|nr:hypothetical protein BT69DRAFT_1286637 [Atractiella rhizophila]